MRQKFHVTTAVVLAFMLAIGVTSMAGAPAGRQTAADVTGHGDTAGSRGTDPVRNNVRLTSEQKGEAVPGGTVAEKANAYLAAARQSENVDVSMLYVRKVLAMDLPADGKRVNKIRFDAHLAMADLLAGTPVKRAHHLVMASRYIDNPAETQSLMSLIEDMGIDPITIDSGTPLVARTAGVADTCDVANATTPHAVVGDLDTDTLTIEVGGDEDWYTINVATGNPAGGLAFRIETFTDQPGVPPLAGDDSTLWLYSDCPGTDLIGFNDDKPGSFMSRIDTACLPEGTYYLKINAFQGNPVFKADNIDLEIEATGSCTFVIADGYEADDSRAEANGVDFGDLGIQAHSIFPAGDNDWVKFGLAANTHVRVRTACGFPTVLNGFAECVNPPELDSVISLWYTSPNVPVAGLCNDQASPGVLINSPNSGCNVDADCPANADPFPGLPDCVTWNFFAPGTAPINAVDNALAFNDDSGGGLGSELDLCLPKTGDSPSSSVNADPASFNWYVRANGFGSAVFDYELLVEDLGPCNFESEPNDDPIGANDIVLGDGVNGIFDYSATTPAPDQDWFKFDVPAPDVYLFETHSFDPGATDTFIELIVGPDGDGNFFLTGDSSDDEGVGLLSRIEATLFPACELLGTCAPAPGGGGAPAAYYVNVGAAVAQPNYPYELQAEKLEGVFAEFIDFEDCSVDPTPAAVNNRFKASIGDFCDFDGYRFHLDEDSQVKMETQVPFGGGFVDTVLQLVDCETLAPLGCSDDNGAGYASLMNGCLPGGRDYCVRTRAWSGFSTFDYEINITGGASCVPTDPPTVSGTGGSRCGAGFDTAGDCSGEFTTCPEPPLLVVLESFTAQPTVNGVVIAWTTATEIDVAGFRLLRGSSLRSKSLVTITPQIIPARGQALVGASYEFTDQSKLADGTYFYILEDIDLSGRATRHGPIEVRVGGNRAKVLTRVAASN